MSVDPTSIICEVLGQPADEMRNPANADYQCPYLEGECVKRSQQLNSPYPVCTIFRSAFANPTCVCPKRFNDIDIVEDIIANCWPGSPPDPRSIKVVGEVKMGHLGNMDLVLVELSAAGTIEKFVSVEYQAIDITGSYFPAYSALTNSEFMEKRPTYGFNWMNVYKRYVTQLIGKGFQHQAWQTIMVSVMQDDVMDRIIQLGNIVPVALEHSNVVFLGYRYEFDEDEGVYKLVLSKVIGTTHSNIMQGTLYRQMIDINEVKAKLLLRLKQLEE